MEALYAKLYESYIKLKTKKFSELDQINEDQEVKFVNYVSAAEELIGHLQDEKERLRAQVNDLRSEVASIRSMKDEQYVELMKKDDEIERLLNLQQGQHCSSSKDGRQVNMLGSALVGSASESICSSKRRTRKRGRSSKVEAEDKVSCVEIERFQDLHQKHSLEEDDRQIIVSNFSSKELTIQLPECSRRIIDGNNSLSTTCLFQELLERIVGMKFSVVNLPEGVVSFSAVHESSGYSFSLTWPNKLVGEAEVKYRVLSLGTLERVAAQCLKEDISFSLNMCPMLFERISRSLKF